MKIDLEKIATNAATEIKKAANEETLEGLRVKYLGRKQGILTKSLKEIPKLAVNERAGIGTKIKEVRTLIENALDQRSKETKASSTSEEIDVTAPGKKTAVGSLHPLTKVLEEVKEIFHYLGFTWVEGPEVETDLYNFQKLNMPPDHPARDVQQTYYINEELLLRTHTSNMQVRYLEKHKPPIRVLFPGRCYRRDMPDATHYPSFYQIEGLAVDETIAMTDLLGSLDFFIKEFFGAGTKMRAYGHNFPIQNRLLKLNYFTQRKVGWKF